MTDDKPTYDRVILWVRVVTATALVAALVINCFTVMGIRVIP